MARFHFEQLRRDTEISIAQIKKHMAWPSAKVKAKLNCDKWSLKRELKEEQDFLDWINANDPDVKSPGAAPAYSSVGNLLPPSPVLSEEN